MTPEERFERIEANLQKTSELQVTLVEAQINLDALIRAITTEHKNGKQKG